MDVYFQNAQPLEMAITQIWDVGHNVMFRNRVPVLYQGTKVGRVGKVQRVRQVVSVLDGKLA